MKRRLAQFGAAAVFGLAVCGANVATTTAVASPSCTDHADNGGGNSGDPGNGQNHHNESNGTGNIGDPGNAGGKFCPTDT
jgi:hypothetical protein